MEDDILRRGLTRHLPGPTKVSSIPAAIAFFAVFVRLRSGWLVSLRRQYNQRADYNVAACGWEQGAKRDQVCLGGITSWWNQVLVGSRWGVGFVSFSRVFLWGMFPESYHLPSGGLYWVGLRETLVEKLGTSRFLRLRCYCTRRQWVEFPRGMLNPTPPREHPWGTGPRDGAKLRPFKHKIMTYKYSLHQSNQSYGLHYDSQS